MALGVDVDQELSPSLVEKLVYCATLLKSFQQTDVAFEKLLGLNLGRKRIERITERIGAERVHQRDAAVEAVAALKLMPKLEPPQGVIPPVACAVMADGGRLQLVDPHPESGQHWFEDKAGLCLELGSLEDADDPTLPPCDPCPEVPSFLLDLAEVETLTREIGRLAAENSSNAPGATDTPLHLLGQPAASDRDQLATPLDGGEQLSPAVTLPSAKVASSPSARDLPLSPRIKRREIVATLGNAHEFGQLLVARTWELGMFQSERKGFVGDGGNWLWTLYERAFQPFGFIGILDIIHGVTHVFAAAMAGRERTAGGAIYGDWITWIWRGEVGRVISALEARQDELGLAEKNGADSSPQKIVASTVTYLRNQQSHMNYPHYREQGLPITSSHMESTMKELNYRVKGTEKFWSEFGGEAVLQLRADSLSDSDPLEEFWRSRSQTRSGFHACVGARKPRQST
jgi:hypothetical protein